MREYELMFVLAPDLQEDGVTTATERITTLITNRGGEITKVDTWGRRRLAYPIRRHRDGFYTVMRFRLEPNLTDELERNLRLIEQVLRHIMVRAEDIPVSRTIRPVGPARMVNPAGPMGGPRPAPPMGAPAAGPAEANGPAPATAPAGPEGAAGETPAASPPPPPTAPVTAETTAPEPASAGPVSDAATPEPVSTGPVVP